MNPDLKRCSQNFKLKKLNGQGQTKISLVENKNYTLFHSQKKAMRKQKRGRNICISHSSSESVEGKQSERKRYPKDIKEDKYNNEKFNQERKKYKNLLAKRVTLHLNKDLLDVCTVDKDNYLTKSCSKTKTNSKPMKKKRCLTSEKYGRKCSKQKRNPGLINTDKSSPFLLAPRSPQDQSRTPKDNLVSPDNSNKKKLNKIRMQVRKGETLRSDIEIGVDNSSNSRSKFIVKDNTTIKRKSPLDYEANNPNLMQTQTLYSNFASLQTRKRERPRHRKINSVYDPPKMTLKLHDFLAPEDRLPVKQRIEQLHFLTKQQQRVKNDFNVTMDHIYQNHKRSFSFNLQDFRLKVSQKESPQEPKEVIKFSVSSNCDSKEISEISSWDEDDFNSSSTRIKKEVKHISSIKMVSMNKFNTRSFVKKSQEEEIHNFRCKLGSSGKTIKDFEMSKKISKFIDFPMYIGYYFRESFRNSIGNFQGTKNLIIKKFLENPKVIQIEKDIFLPEKVLAYKDLNQKHVIHSLQGLSCCNGFLNGPDCEYKSRKVTLPHTNRKKLAVFDMDETLIHCVPYSCYKDKPEMIEECDVSIDCDIGPDNKLYVNIRPYIIEALREIKKEYQIIVFTASVQQYADPILNFIDPDHQLFDERFYRESCFDTGDGTSVKDLRIFEDQWDLKNIILVDNFTVSFGMQVSNGFPILPFYDRKDDLEMVYLTYFLKRIAKENDIRIKLTESFWLETLKIPEICDSITGVIEYAVEEISEDCFNTLNNKTPIHSRKNTKLIKVQEPVTPCSIYDAPSQIVPSSHDVFSKFTKKSYGCSPSSIELTKEKVIEATDNLEEACDLSISKEPEVQDIPKKMHQAFHQKSVVSLSTKLNQNDSETCANIGHDDRIFNIAFLSENLLNKNVGKSPISNLESIRRNICFTEEAATTEEDINLDSLQEKENESRRVPQILGPASSPKKLIDL
ncbi:unnamed protein product [Moneuplotes crassus]|uniref:FCP1 homology domain-containing protein n=1 Tax=Euplotes crassus TaxID=5936 RepID=A0AAD2D3X9_EUPCR|nr:unnamed protein product [Moneuplotes crassus]